MYNLRELLDRFGDGSKPMAERYGGGHTPSATPGTSPGVTPVKPSSPVPISTVAGGPTGSWGGDGHLSDVPHGASAGPDGDSYMGQSSRTTGSSKDSGPLG